METLTLHLSRPEVAARLALLGPILSGGVSDPSGMVQQLQLALGVQALSLIKEAFIVKARGGTDAAGISWPKLSPKTVAYSRKHPGLQRKHPGDRPRGLLTDAQDKRWRGIWLHTWHWLQHKQGLGSKEAAGNAAAHAWFVLEAEGAKTILKEYGSVPVEILRDTDRLLNSLSPGIGGPSGNPDQVFDLQPGAVAVGTNVVYAGTHHRGNPARNVPARPLWPEADQWPQAWIDELADILTQGLALIFRTVMAA